MENHLTKLTTQVEITLNNLPDKLIKLETILNDITIFPSHIPSDIQKKFESLLASQTEPLTNKTVLTIQYLLRDELTDALDTVQKIERWIQLMVPKIEDGNNFGVEVQKMVLHQISASKVALQTAWDTLPDYTWQRATAYEKFTSKKTAEKVISTSKSQSKGGKEGEENKITENETNKESTSSIMIPLPDYIAYIVSIDVKWYFNMKRILENIRDHYIFTADIVEKNKQKVTLPRGSGRNSLHMF